MNGEDLRRRRRELGISQAALGRLIGVPQQTIARWETGKHRIEHGQMLDLALRALEIERAAALAKAPWVGELAWPHEVEIRDALDVALGELLRKDERDG